MAEQQEVTTEIDKTTLGALSYILLFITGLLFYLIYKDRFIRFHARQSVFVFGPLVILLFVFSALGLREMGRLLWVLIFTLWLVLIYKAWLGQEWRVPVLGDMVDDILGKLSKQN